MHLGRSSLSIASDRLRLRHHWPLCCGCHLWNPGGHGPTNRTDAQKRQVTRLTTGRNLSYLKAYVMMSNSAFKRKLSHTIGIKYMMYIVTKCKFRPIPKNLHKMGSMHWNGLSLTAMYLEMDKYNTIQYSRVVLSGRIALYFIYIYFIYIYIINIYIYIYKIK